MRRPLHGDVISVARVLLGVPAARRGWVLHRMVREAEIAHRWVEARHSAHPRWGDGSLMTTALRRRPRGEPALDDADYCRCLGLTFDLLARRGDQPLVQDTQRGTVGSRSRRARSRSSPQSWQ